MSRDFRRGKQIFFGSADYSSPLVINFPLWMQAKSFKTGNPYPFLIPLFSSTNVSTNRLSVHLNVSFVCSLLVPQ